MGEVWRAEREGPAGVKRRAALKRILAELRENPELLARFLAEARISSRLEHSNIVSVLDFADQPEPYLVFEYVEGVSAADILQEASRGRIKLPATAAAFICAEVASGLDYAHRKRDDNGVALQIVHRDVSPHNVLVSVEGAVKVGDFGVARAIDNTFRTRDGIQVGKLVYMSPEQSAGQPLDGRADVYSLGVVLWELLTLKPLFPRDDPATTLRMQRNGEVPRPSSIEPQLPAVLDDIVLRALAPDPANRFATAGLFAQALREFVHSLAPGFDSGELVRILNKIAPSVAWHVRTPPPGGPHARAAIPASPMPVGHVHSPPQAQPGSPVAPVGGPPKQPAMASPPAPRVAGPHVQHAQPVHRAPVVNSAVVASSAAQTPTHSLSQPSIMAPSSNARAIALGLGGGMVLLLLAGAVGYYFYTRDARDNEDVSERATPLATQLTPLGAAHNLLTQVTADASSPLPTLPTSLPTIAPTLPVITPPVAPESGATHPTASSSAVLVRALNRNISAFRGCIPMAGGMSARINVRLEIDGPTRTVQSAESTSTDVVLAVHMRQCIKRQVEHSIAAASLAGQIRTRWHFSVASRDTEGF